MQNLLKYVGTYKKDKKNRTGNIAKQFMQTAMFMNKKLEEQAFTTKIRGFYERNKIVQN